MNWIFTALITSASWGLTYVAAENALKNIDKRFYLVICTFLNFVFWLFYFFLNINKIEIKTIENKSFFWLLVACISAIIGNYFCISAIQGKNAVSASIIEISYPLFCVGFSFFLTGKLNLTIESSVGMFFVLIGMFIFIIFQRN